MSNKFVSQKASSLEEQKRKGEALKKLFSLGKKEVK